MVCHYLLLLDNVAKIQFSRSLCFPSIDGIRIVRGGRPAGIEFPNCNVRETILDTNVGFDSALTSSPPPGNSVLAVQLLPWYDKCPVFVNRKNPTRHDYPARPILPGGF